MECYEFKIRRNTRSIIGWQRCLIFCGVHLLLLFHGGWVVVITKIMLHLGMEMVALKAIGEPIILSYRTRRIIKEVSSIKSLMQQQSCVVIQCLAPRESHIYEQLEFFRIVLDADVYRCLGHSWAGSSSFLSH